MVTDIAVQRKTVECILDQLYLGVRAGARASVREARKHRSRDAAYADAHLARAANLPRRALARLAAAEEDYDATHSAGSWVEWVDEGLSRLGPITIAQIRGDLEAMEQRLAGVRATAGDAEALATQIDAATSDDVKRWTLPLPAGYRDQPVLGQRKGR